MRTTALPSCARPAMSIVPAGSAERTATAGRQFAGQVAEPLRRLMRAETGSDGLLLAATLTRELAMGELIDRRRALVPLVASGTGLALPAAIFLAFNPTGETAQAWGVVISTDTAFVLALAGPSAPTQLRIFLLTLAGAVIFARPAHRNPSRTGVATTG